MKRNKELTVIIPVYNESEVILEVIHNWKKVLNRLSIDFLLAVYNDGSTDNTYDLLDSQFKNDKVVSIINKSNSGHGPTILQGYKEHLNSKWLFQIDSDNEISEEYFELLWKERENYDFLIGNRKNRNTPLIRQFISLISRITIRLKFGNSVTDVNCPYRLFRSSKVSEYLKKIPEDTLAPNLIISGLASRLDLTVFELPVKYNLRTTGEVSIKKWKLIKFSIKSFKQTLLFAQ